MLNLLFKIAFSLKLYSLIPVKSWRRKVKKFFKEKIKKAKLLRYMLYTPGFYEKNDYVYAEGYYNMGVSWQEYLLTNNMPEKVARLRQNLDDNSLQAIDRILSGLTILPCRRSGSFMVRKSALAPFNTEEEKRYQEQHFHNQKKYKNEFILDEDVLLHGSLTVHYGLVNKADAVKKHIAGRDVIEAGAYIGTGALVLSKIYSAKRVYSFEVSARTRERYLKTMEMNHMSEDRWRLVPMGLSDRQTVAYIFDSGHMGTSISVDGELEVALTTLDSFVREAEEKLDIGFIMLDVEGAGINALKGMADTIRAHRPIISIGIYHSPEEFFEIKPLLETIVVDFDYKITIEKVSNCIFPQVMVAQLFAYPKELDCSC